MIINIYGVSKSKFYINNLSIKTESIGTSLLENNCVTLEKMDKSISDVFIEQYENQEVIMKSGFMQTNGVLSTYESCKYCSFPVTKNEKFKIFSRYGYSMVQYVLLSSEQKVISYYPLNNSEKTVEETNTFLVPQDGTLYVNTYNNIKIAKKTSYEIINSKFYPLFNKKILFFGDSITAGQGSWADDNTIRLKYNMQGANYGVGGSTYTVKSDSNNSNCILNRIKYVKSLSTMDDADYIILQGGVNDAFQNLTLGALSDTKDFTTEFETNNFAGAFEMAIRFVLTNWPGSKVGFIANAKIPRNVKLKNFMDLAKEICNKYSVPVLDLWNNSGMCAGIPDINEKYFGIDGEDIGHGGTHPTPLGYEKYINSKVESWLNSL